MGFIALVVIFHSLPLAVVDWRGTFYQVARQPLQPYTVRTFINPPWLALWLWPLGLLSEQWSYAINAALTVWVFGALAWKRSKSPLSVTMTLTSVPFFSLVLNGGAEWIPALGFLLPNAWGVVLLATKPQIGIFAALDWFMKSPHKWRYVYIGAGALLGSLLLWRGWLESMINNYLYVQNVYNMHTWNYSPFPWLVPVGIGLLYYMARYKPKDGELYGVIATLCLVPYFTFHSLTLLFALVSARYKRIGLLLWAALWLWILI